MKTNTLILITCCYYRIRGFIGEKDKDIASAHHADDWNDAYFTEQREGEIDMLNTTVIQGRDLPDATIDFMIKQRILEYGENTKDFRKNELESVFFLLTERDAIRAFGMLKPLTILHRNKQYPILGIGSIMSVEKGQGWGRILMSQIQNYLRTHNMTGMGFCDPSICGFYAKCGFQILENLAVRFRYLYADRDGQRAQLDGNRGVLYFEGPDALGDKLLEDNELIYIDVPFW